MLLPKFSIRHLMLIMIGIGILSSCLAGASRGNELAFALATAIMVTPVPFLIYGLVYWIGLIVAQSTGKTRRDPANPLPAAELNAIPTNRGQSDE